MFKYKIVTPLLMWFIVGLGVIGCFVFVDDWRLFNSNYVNKIVFIGGIIFWFYLFGSAIKVHRQAVKSMDKINKLVTTGIYAKMRHPIYVGDILLAWSFFILFPRLDILLSVVWLNLILLVWMKVEERSLLAKFGQEYQDYKRRTRWFKF